MSKDGASKGLYSASILGVLTHDDLGAFVKSLQLSNYVRFFVMSVSHNLAQSMMSDMIQEINSPYNPFTSNCGQAIENVLFKNNNISVPSNLSPNFSFDYIQSSTNGVPYVR